jgi:methanogenic corrinoid protein MtbC1
MAGNQGHAIKVVVNRTGLSPHVIRIWEKRYAAVTPRRTPTNRRLYSDADIKRLVLLRQATLAGHSIGHIANLPTDRLIELVAEDKATALTAAPRAQSRVDTPGNRSHADACMAAIERLDTVDLEASLMRARVSLSQPAFIEQVIAPLMTDIGERWRDGSLRIMHEHLCTAVVRSILGVFQESVFDLPASAPVIVLTTPVGQLHEIGALLVACTAASEGWNIAYLGPNLPAEEIAAAARQKAARAVALSLIYPADDPRTQQELVRLRRYLPQNVALIVGGRVSDAYGEVLDTLGALRLPDMSELRTCLETLRIGDAVT